METAAHPEGAFTPLDCEAEALMGLADIKLRLQPGGGPESILVNGQDLSNQVSAVQVQASTTDRIPIVVLQLLGDVDIEGEGIVHLQTELDPELFLNQFLSCIDPEELETRALAGMEGLGEPETTGQSFLRALKEMAVGYVDGS